MATLNQFIVGAVVEKVSALKTAECFQNRATRGDKAKALRILRRKCGAAPRAGEAARQSSGSDRRMESQTKPRAALGRRTSALLACMLVATGLPAQTATGFVLLNERPANEDRPRFLSTNAWSCGFGIRVFSDEGRAFDRVTRLGEALRSSLGPRLEGHTLRLKSYQVYFNEAARRSDVVDSVVAGSVGATTGGTRRIAPKCSQEKTPGGWFDPSELANDNPPFITQIEADLDGMSLSTRSVYSPSIALTVPPTALSGKARKNFADETSGPEVEKAMMKANAEFVEQVARRL